MSAYRTQFGIGAGRLDYVLAADYDRLLSLTRRLRDAAKEASDFIALALLTDPDSPKLRVLLDEIGKVLAEVKELLGD